MNRINSDRCAKVDDLECRWVPHSDECSDECDGV